MAPLEPLAGLLPLGGVQSIEKNQELLLLHRVMKWHAPRASMRRHPMKRKLMPNGDLCHPSTYRVHLAIE
jgi:hypothetical protein